MSLKNMDHVGIIIIAIILLISTFTVLSPNSCLFMILSMYMCSEIFNFASSLFSLCCSYLWVTITTFTTFACTAFAPQLILLS